MQSSGDGNRSKEDSEYRMGIEHTVQMTSQQPESVEQGHNPLNTVKAPTSTPFPQAATSMQMPSQTPPIAPNLHERLLPEDTMTLPSHCQTTLQIESESPLLGNMPLQPDNSPVSPRSNENLLAVGVQSEVQCPIVLERPKHLLPAVNTPLDSQLSIIFPKSYERLQLRGIRRLGVHETIPARCKASILPVNNPLESQSSHILSKPRSQLPAVSTSQDSQPLPTPATCGNINAQETVEVSIKVGSQESHILCSGSERPLSPIQVRIKTFNLPLTYRQEEMIRSAANAALQNQLWHIPATPNARQLLVYNNPHYLTQLVALQTRGQRPMAADNTTVQFQHMNVSSKSCERPPPTNMLSSISSSNTFIQRLPLMPNLEFLQTDMLNLSTRLNMTRPIQTLDRIARLYYHLPAEMNNPNFLLGSQERTQRSLSIEPSEDQEILCKSIEEVMNSIPAIEEQIVSHQKEISLAMFQALTLMEQRLHSQEQRLHSQEQRLHSQEQRLHSQEQRLHSQEQRLHSQEQRLHSQELSLSEQRRVLFQQRLPSQEQAPPKITSETLQRQLLSEETTWEETSDSSLPPEIRIDDLIKCNRTLCRMGVRHRRKKVICRRLPRHISENIRNMKYSNKRKKGKTLLKARRTRNRINNSPNQNYEEKSTAKNRTRYSISNDGQKVEKCIEENSKESAYEICEREIPGTSGRIPLESTDTNDADDGNKENSHYSESSS